MESGSGARFLGEIIKADTELKVVPKLILVDTEATICGQKMYFESTGSTTRNQHCVNRLRALRDKQNALLGGDLRGV